MNYNKSYVSRMYIQAIGYIADGDLLSEMFDTMSDAPSLLKILGFEIFLKCILKIHFPDSKNHTHNYYKLWQKLPNQLKANIIEGAQQRYTIHANYQNMQKVVNFVAKGVRESALLL